MQSRPYRGQDSRLRALGTARTITLALAGGSVVAAVTIADVAAQSTHTTSSRPASPGSTAGVSSSGASSSGGSSGLPSSASDGIVGGSGPLYSPPAASTSPAHVSSGAS